MATNYYDIYYADGGYEQVYRHEDMLACKLGKRKVKSIKHREYTVNGWKEKVIVWNQFY